MSIETDPDFFWRKIASAVPDPDPQFEHCYNVTLSCGHEIILVMEPSGGTLPCSQCMEEWLENNRAEKQPI